MGDDPVLLPSASEELDKAERLRREHAFEARILRRVAAALRGGHTPAWLSRGGPQDGDDTPESFDVPSVVVELERQADDLMKPARPLRTRTSRHVPTPPCSSCKGLAPNGCNMCNSGGLG